MFYNIYDSGYVLPMKHILNAPETDRDLHQSEETFARGIDILSS